MCCRFSTCCVKKATAIIFSVILHMGLAIPNNGIIKAWDLPCRLWIKRSLRLVMRRNKCPRQSEWIWRKLENAGEFTERGQRWLVSWAGAKHAQFASLYTWLNMAVTHFSQLMQYFASLLSQLFPAFPSTFIVLYLKYFFFN